MDTTAPLRPWGSRPLATAGAALMLVDAARLVVLPAKHQTAFTDAFEIVVAALCATACMLAAARSSRLVKAQWSLVAAFFVIMSLADVHDLLAAVLQPGFSGWSRVLEVVGWLTYLPLAFLVVLPVDDEDHRSSLIWTSALDFLQVALVLGLVYFDYIYLPHASSHLPWTVRGRPEDVRNVLLSAGLLLRAVVDPTKCARALYVRVGGTFAVVTLVQGLFTHSQDAAHLLGRPAALLTLGLLAAHWRSDRDQTPEPGHRALVTRWVLGLAPASGPLLILALAARVPPQFATGVRVLFAVSLAVFVVRAGAVEYQRQASARIEKFLYGITQHTSSAQDLQQLYVAVRRLLERFLPVSTFYVALRDTATGAVNLSDGTATASQREPDTAERELVEEVLRTGESRSVARAERWGSPARRETEPAEASRSGNLLGIPLRSGDSAFGVLLAQRHTASFGDQEQGALAFVAQHLAFAIERRRAEDAVHASEERFRQAVRASRVGVFDHDQRKDTVYWSPELREMFGWSLDENVTLQEFFERVHPADRQRLAEAGHRAHDPAGDGLYQAEFRIARRDGSVRWTAARSQTSFEGEGPARRPKRTVGAVLELTERKRAEEELRESERVLLESQRVARLGSFRTDLISGTWTCSTILDEIFGIDDPSFRKDVPGWLSTVHPEQRDQMAVYFADEVLGRRKAFDREYRIRRLNDREERWVHGLGKLVLDDDGRPIEMIGTIQDITERKAEEEEKAGIEAMLLRSQKMEAIGRLAGGVAHDFNNLLSVIRGHSERLLADPGTGDARRSRLEQIVWAADKGGSLTRQLLAFSSRQVMAPRVLRLDAVVADARQMLERVIGEDVELIVRTPASVSCVRADPGQLVQVLLNLAVNSRDAMPHGGRLTIEVEDIDADEAFALEHPPLDVGAYVRMAVSDTGQGMDAETRRRVFEPFFTTKPESEGTGLGLSTVYGIVKQSEGFVWVDSEVGAGATFTVFLPRISEPVPASIPVVTTPPPARPTPDPGRRILLVEDDDGVRELMAEALGSAGYLVLASGRAADALELARSEAIDLLVTDVIMPGMSGSELALELASRQPELRVLFVSGYAGEALTRRGRIELGEHFLQKPFSGQQLLDGVAAALAVAVAGEADPGPYSKPVSGPSPDGPERQSS